jgi:3-oxoadipate enol-lactonase
MVFVHGWLGSWRYWVPVMEDLATDFRSYALDLWGFGDSDKSREQYDLDGYVDLLVAFMDELGIWRAPLVGHTLGSAVAVRLAARHPDRVSKVLAVGLPPTVGAINHRLLTAGPNHSLARLFWHRQRPYPEVEMSTGRIAENAIALTIQSVVRLDLGETLDQIDVPVLTVYGEKDNVISADSAEVLEDAYSAVRAIVLLDAYHFAMLDQTAKFARLLRDFVDVETPEELRNLTVKEEWRRRTR